MLGARRGIGLERRDQRDDLIGAGALLGQHIQRQCGRGGAVAGGAGGVKRAVFRAEHGDILDVVVEEEAVLQIVVHGFELPEAGMRGGACFRLGQQREDAGEIR